MPSINVGDVIQLSVDGVDISGHVTDVRLEVSENCNTFQGIMSGPIRIYRTVNATIELSGGMDLLNLLHHSCQSQRRGPTPDQIIVDEIPDFADAVARDATEVWRERPVRRTHDFFQDPNEEATLCGFREMGTPGIETCGMWPEHHNHSRAGKCYCAECHPNADNFGDYSSYTRGDC